MSDTKPSPTALNMPGELERLAQVAFGRLAHYRRLNEAYTQAAASLRDPEDQRAIELNREALTEAVTQARRVIADADANRPAIAQITPRQWRSGPEGPPHAS